MVYKRGPSSDNLVISTSVQPIVTFSSVAAAFLVDAAGFFAVDAGFFAVEAGFAPAVEAGFAPGEPCSPSDTLTALERLELVAVASPSAARFFPAIDALSGLGRGGQV